MTVGDLRVLLRDLPDDTPVSPRWAYGPPSDSDPAVTIDRFEVQKGVLAVMVSLDYLNEDEDED